MTIRLMTPADYDAVYALWDGTPGVGLNALDDSREGIARYLARNPTSCFVALEDGGLAGVILAGHDGRRGVIYHMTVSPAQRRKGIGKALVDAALGALKAEGITKVLLVVMKSNDTGNKFWESIGFTEREDLVYRNLRIIG
jgi:ribosomal protein S18 acetylase RimI-like enzyme